MKTRRLNTIILTALLFAFVASSSYAEVKLKIAVVNPSSTEAQSTPIRYDLPKGIGPEQVVDIGALEMKYDFDKNNYYITGNVNLAPSEKKVFDISISDVWSIPETQLTGLKNHVDMLLTKIKNTKHFATGKELSKDLNTRLDAIIAKEKIANANIRERINEYYENMVILDEIKENIGMLENLVIDTGGIVEDRVQVPTTLAVPLGIGDISGDKEVMELKVKVTNPSATKKQATPVKYLLPSEITPRYIIDRSNLDMAYDFNKECFYLYKDNLELDPSQVKEFVVKVKDVWRISDVELDVLKKHTANIMLLLQYTDYASRAKLASDKISNAIDRITKTQGAKVSPAEHIAYYRDNTKLLQDAKLEIAELERLVSQRGVTAGITVQWPEDKQGGGSKVTKTKGYEGLDVIAQSIFKGRAPTIATTWKIIFTIIGFIGIIAASFFALWYVQSKKKAKK